ncbi:MAG: peptidylprolyl isomerase [Anaerolineae bacterium]|nr:peptidylprolyl isomerase [Anaerolineae bacterium]
MNRLSVGLFILLIMLLAVWSMSAGQMANPALAAFQASTPTATAAAAYVPLEGHALGPETAAVTLILYGDFQCVPCAQYAQNLEILRDHYPDSLRLIWRHLPDIRAHDKAALALQASEAAAAQGQFWPMHDQLFTHQPDWIDLPPEVFRAVVDGYAQTVGLDMERFKAALDSGIYAAIVDAARRDAAELDFVSGPVLLINGIPYTGRDDLFGLDEAVRLALLRVRQFEAPPDMVIDPANDYRATIRTEKGDIVIDLFPDKAPVTVNNFVFLARAGWYDGMTFYYVVPDFLAQTGDPSDTGRGDPGYTIPDEHTNGLRFERSGLVAMAHPPGLPNSAGSAFFITLAPLQPSGEWDGQYTIFGAVIEGLDVARRLTPRNTNDPVNFPAPLSGDRVLTITIEEIAP